MEHELGKRPRKKPKRFIESDDEDNEPTSPAAPRSRRMSVVSSEADHAHEEDLDVDGDTYDEQPPPGPTPKAKTSSTSRGKTKRRADETPQPAPKKKARRVVAPEEEDDEDFYAAIAEEVPEPDDEDEDEYEPEEKPVPRIKLPAKSKTAASTAKGKKREKAADPFDNVAEGPSRKRARPLRQTHSELSVDVVGDGEDSSHVDSRAASVHGSTPTVPTKRESPTPAPPTKKGKLPPIKKTKASGSVATLPGSAASSGSGAKKPPEPLPGLLKSSQDELRKNMIEATDLDLSNKSVYDELFKGTLGGAPRPGISRKTREEERRKELDKQKEEYIAKLTEAAARTFDLQANVDRISRFEEGLRAKQSSAVYPNFLAAKWRENWEREKRRQKDLQMHHSYQPPHHNHAVEEGEVE